MNNFDIDKIDRKRPIFFIGIGGISMSALAITLKSHGFLVCGSDFKESEMTNLLEEKGILVSIGHKKENIKDPALVVYTAAIKEDNPELLEARRKNIETIERPVLLGAIMKRFKNAIAVSGTHGKTTTTSMMAQVLLEAQTDPTILVGGILPSIGGNLRDGGTDYLVTEACEYCGSFLKFLPTVSIILNIEEDHLDYFKDIYDICDCFRKFAQLTPDDGVLIANFDDENVRNVVCGLDKKVLSFAIENQDADYTARNIVFSDEGYPSFDVFYRGELLFLAELSVLGEHNIKNALSTIAAAHFLNLPLDAIKKGLFSFAGSKRRFEKKGEYEGAMIYDDYAHHPTEIKASLKSAKNMKKEGKTYCVFQPHTYTRTLMLKSEFGESFKDADVVIVADIYAAREKDTGLISSSDLTDEINSVSKNAIYMSSFPEITDYIKENAKKGDVVITMGAGDIYKIADELVKK